MSTQQRNGKPSGLPAWAGVVSFVLSWVIIFVQLFGDPSRVNWMFLVLAGLMSGVPSAVAAANMILSRGAAPDTTGGTPVGTGSPTPPPLPPASPSSPLSSGAGER